jgi:uncharacterized protein YidB (DUF937 family)
MTALLGLLAVAGYQNRDKLAEMLGGQGGGARTAPGGRSLDNILPGGLGAGGIGGLLSGGLGELVERFRSAGRPEIADSWVRKGPNQQVSEQDLEQVIGSDTLDDLEQRTGMTRAEIIARLSRELPDAVDNYTPDGAIPRMG